MASTTTPASLKPDCGRASGLFSIMIPVTGRWFSAGSTWTPVKREGSVLGFSSLLVWATLVTGLTLVNCLNSRMPPITVKSTAAKIAPSIISHFLRDMCSGLKKIHLKRCLGETLAGGWIGAPLTTTEGLTVFGFWSFCSESFTFNIVSDAYAFCSFDATITSVHRLAFRLNL